MKEKKKFFKLNLLLERGKKILSILYNIKLSRYQEIFKDLLTHTFSKINE